MDNQEKLTLLSQQPFKLLIIDDDYRAQQALIRNFHSIFPHSKIEVFPSMTGEEEDIQVLIEEGEYDLIALDGRLTKWKKKQLNAAIGTHGADIVPIIRKKSPCTFILAISVRVNENEIMLEKGADLAIQKHNILDLLRK